MGGKQVPQTPGPELTQGPHSPCSLQPPSLQLDPQTMSLFSAMGVGSCPGVRIPVVSSTAAFLKCPDSPTQPAGLRETPSQPPEQAINNSYILKCIFS